MAAYQQVGSFEVVDEHGQLQRNGGNVASYFCTPEGRVIEAVTGPVRAAELLDEARWAVSAYDDAKTSQASDAAARLARAHRQAERPEPGRTSNSRAIHQLLAARPLPPVNAVYQEVFERILGQRVNLPGDGIEQVAEAVAFAKARQLPIVFILHKEQGRNKDQGNSATIATWNSLLAEHESVKADPLPSLADSYVVIALPLNALPAASGRLGIRPYAASGNESPLLVVARPDGRQLTSVTTWNKIDELTRALALGLVQGAKEHPRTEEQLTRLLALVKPVDSNLAGEVRRLLAPVKLKGPALPSPKRGEKVAFEPPTAAGIQNRPRKQEG